MAASAIPRKNIQKNQNILNKHHKLYIMRSFVLILLMLHEWINKAWWTLAQDIFLISFALVNVLVHPCFCVVPDLPLPRYLNLSMPSCWCSPVWTCRLRSRVLSFPATLLVIRARDTSRSRVISVGKSGNLESSLWGKSENLESSLWETVRI